MNTKVLVSISAISSMVNVIPMLAQTPKPNVVIIMTNSELICVVAKVFRWLSLLLPIRWH